jgi:5-methyltetrahydropteroyltriglutamate--homocysteine methyltransferase
VSLVPATLAGSLPKPGWLAETEKLWPRWRLEGQRLVEGKADATLAWIAEQEAAGLDILGDGEQSRHHFVHGFLVGLEGIDFERKKTIGIRADRYKADVPTVTGPIRRKGSVHAAEVRLLRAHTKRKIKFTLPGPMTIVDTLADEHYGDRLRLAEAFADALNGEARELEALGVDVVQFDEPAFNVYMKDVLEWGVATLERAAAGLRCKTAVHICYGYGIKANLDWKATLGSEWRQYEETFPALARSRIDQVSLECASAKVPMTLMALLKGKDVMVGAIDVASDRVETPEEVAATLRAALAYVPKERLIASTNCGMAPMARHIATAKLAALGRGAQLLRQEIR